MSNIEKEALNNEILVEIYDSYPELKNYLKWNEYNVKDKLEHLFWYTQNWFFILQKQKEDLEKIKNILEMITAKRYDYYRFDYVKELKPSEIEKYYLPKDKYIYKVKNKLLKQQFKVNAYEIIYKELDKLYWGIKTWLDNEKLR